MKKKLLLACAAVVAMTASAATEITSGTSYYIQNVESGLYFCGANNWGTRASVSVQGDPFTVTSSDGAYTLLNESLSCGNKYLNTGLYVDGTATNWTIEPVAGESGVFTIKNDNGYIAQASEAGCHIGFVAAQVAEVTSAAKWYFLTKDEAVKKLEAATKTSPIDASFLISGANFSRNHLITAWTMDAGNKNLQGGSNDNLCAESWRSAYTLSQNVTVPNGTYELTAQAALTDYAGSYDGSEYPVVYANDATAPFNDMEEADRGTNMTQLSNSFSSGKYVVGPIKVTVTDGNLKIGVKGTRTDTWCIWDNFQIKYYGEDIEAEAEATNAVYNEIKDAEMNAEAKAAMDAAHDAFVANVTKENLDKYSAAVSAAKTSAYQYASTYVTLKLDAAKAHKLDDAGRAAFEDAVAPIESALESGTMTYDMSAEVDAAYAAAVKAQGVGGDFTTAAPASWVGASGSLDANTWANATSFDMAERYDGAGSIAVGDVMTQTITGLKPGVYSVTLNLAGSYTSGRGFECPTGDGLSVGFANDATANLPVVDRTTLAADGATTMTLDAAVIDGTLTYGIKNVAAAGNWYGANVSSIVYKSGITDEENYEVKANAVVEQGGASQTASFTHQNVKTYLIGDYRFVVVPAAAVNNYSMPESTIQGVVKAANGAISLEEGAAPTIPFSKDGVEGVATVKKVEGSINNDVLKLTVTADYTIGEESGSMTVKYNSTYDAYIVKAKVTVEQNSATRTEVFSNQTVKASDEDVIIPAATLDPYSMEETTIEGLVKDEDGFVTLAMGAVPTIKFYKGDLEGIATVTDVNGLILDDDVNLTVTATYKVGTESGTITAVYSKDATAVNTVSAAKAGAANGKYVKNGRVVVVKNGKQYDAAGAMLK